MYSHIPINFFYMMLESKENEIFEDMILILKGITEKIYLDIFGNLSIKHLGMNVRWNRRIFERLKLTLPVFYRSLSYSNKGCRIIVYHFPMSNRLFSAIWSLLGNVVKVEEKRKCKAQTCSERSA